MTTIEPWSDRLLVQPDPNQTETASGIIIPEVSQKAAQQGTVLAIGPDHASSLAVGDRIIYALYGGISFDLDGEPRMVLNPADILAIVRAG